MMTMMMIVKMNLPEMIVLGTRHRWANGLQAHSQQWKAKCFGFSCMFATMPVNQCDTCSIYCLSMRHGSHQRPLEMQHLRLSFPLLTWLQPESRSWIWSSVSLLALSASGHTLSFQTFWICTAMSVIVMTWMQNVSVQLLSESCCRTTLPLHDVSQSCLTGRVCKLQLHAKQNKTTRH